VGVSQTAAFNTGRHLYSAGRPSGWALAHISSLELILSFPGALLLGILCIIRRISLLVTGHRTYYSCKDLGNIF